MHTPVIPVLVTALLAFSSAPASSVVPIDTQITSGPENGALLLPGPVTFTFSSTGGTGVTFECSVDDASFDACNGPGPDSATYDLPPGGHLLKVRAVQSMTPDPTPAERMWTVRNVPCEQAGADYSSAQSAFFKWKTRKGYVKEKLQRAKADGNDKKVTRLKKKIKVLNGRIKAAKKDLDAAVAQEQAVC